MVAIGNRVSSKWMFFLRIGAILIGVSAICTFWISLPINNTFFWWSVNFLVLIALYKCKPQGYHPLPLRLWILLIAVYSIWGSFLCRDYWDWKYLVGNIVAYNMCVASLTFSNPNILSDVLSYWFKHAWKIIILLAPFFTYGAAVSKSLIPYSFLALFLPILNKKMRMLVLLSFLLTIVFAYMSRSDVIRFSVCILLGIIVSTQKFYNKMKKMIKPLRFFFLFVPFLLFSLAVTSQFNIFNIQNELGLEEGHSDNGEDIFQDTRTILYEEVLASSIKHNTEWYGGTPARGYESAWVIRNQDNSDVTGAIHYGWRGNTEASVLNVYMHFGLLGLLFYFIIFYMASYYAVYKSNNDYLKTVGLCVAFRWCLGCVEDFTNFDLNMFILWVMISICYSPSFRKMSNSEFKSWVIKTTS